MPPLFITTLRETLRHFKRPIFYVFLIIGAIIDAVFFYTLTRVHVELFLPATRQLNVVMVALQNASQTAAGMTGITDINQLGSVVLQQPSVTVAYHAFLWLLGEFFLLTMLAILVLQGLAWLVAQRITRTTIKPKDYGTYALRFTLFTFCFGFLFLVIIGITSLLQQNALASPLPFLSTNTIFVFFSIAVFVLTYEVTMLYASPIHLSLRHTFILPFRLATVKQLLPAFIITLVLIFDLAGLWFPIFRWQYSVSIAWLFVLILPSLTLSRVYLVKTVGDVERENRDENAD